MEDNLKRRMVDLALLWDVQIIQSVHILEKLVEKSIKTGFFENLLSGIEPALARAGLMLTSISSRTQKPIIVV